MRAGEVRPPARPLREAREVHALCQTSAGRVAVVVVGGGETRELRDVRVSPRAARCHRRARARASRPPRTRRRPRRLNPRDRSRPRYGDARPAARRDPRRGARAMPPHSPAGWFGTEPSTGDETSALVTSDTAACSDAAYALGDAAAAASDSGDARRGDRREQVRVARDLRHDREVLVHLPDPHRLEPRVVRGERLGVGRRGGQRLLRLLHGHLGDVVRRDHLGEHRHGRGRQALRAAPATHAELGGQARDERRELRLERGVGLGLGAGRRHDERPRACTRARGPGDSRTCAAVGRARHDVRRCCAGSQFGFRILKPGERPSVDSGDLPKPKRADTK